MHVLGLFFGGRRSWERAVFSYDFPYTLYSLSEGVSKCVAFYIMLVCEGMSDQSSWPEQFCYFKVSNKCTESHKVCFQNRYTIIFFVALSKENG